ncbi:MAG: CRISPR-associated endonuclease Cas1 [Actinomycetota bacterium]|jgi:CRISPR-associated endonuclease Cas1|nr:CRISPR-associated endonuclease Cas1 [Actinomycetota bacterium]
MDEVHASAASATSGPRIVAMGPALGPDEVADRLEAVANTYGGSGDAHVIVADGFDVKVLVRNSALTICDGMAEHRRERAYPKVAAPERLVVAGDGFLTTEALEWCRAQGTAVVVLARGDVLLGASPPGRNDARIRRAQALAAGSPAGLAAVRHLLCAKVNGQAKILRDVFEAAETAVTLTDLAAGIGMAEDVDEARQLEAVAAAAYFTTWAGHPATAVGFVARDRRRVPPHWQTFDSRRSAITGSANTNRLAERPLNALLNYCYRLAEIEARFACVRLGLDPGLGVLHADAAGRDSLALDLIEPVRPAVDRFVLDLVSERSFHKRDFVERGDGHVRVAAPLTHELATTLPTWRRAVASHAEAVAHLFADQVTGKLALGTPLTNAKATAAQAAVRRRKTAEARAKAEAVNTEHRLAQPIRRPKTTDVERAATLFATCVDCGGPLARSRHVRCPACWERQPGQSRDARKRRGRSIAMARSELERWKAEHPHANADPAAFEPIRAGLSSVKLSAIVAACEVSKATASAWRSGRYVPPVRHWEALANMADAAAR